jgi:hypothetical protein
VLRKRSVHAALDLFVARCDRGKNLRFQSARGSPMSAYWFRRTAALLIATQSAASGTVWPGWAFCVSWAVFVELLSVGSKMLN